MTCRNGLSIGVPGPLRLAFTARPEQSEVPLGQLLLEVAAEVILVTDQRLSAAADEQTGFDFEHAQQRFALVGLGPGAGRTRSAGRARWIHRGPGAKPSSACSTADVISFASLSFGVMPTDGCRGAG